MLGCCAFTRMQSDARSPQQEDPNWCKLKMVGYSRSQMVDGAEANGFGRVSERLVTDWAGLGLLDEPQRSSRGEGGGRGPVYEWPEPQFALFLLLLTKRSEVNRVAPLCLIPVGVWLYGINDWVPTRQVRRALKTWWGGSGEVGQKQRSERSARILVETFFPKKRSKAKTALHRAIAESIYVGHFDVARIERLLQPLIPESEFGSWGPIQFTPEQVVQIMAAVMGAAKRLDEVSDATLERARIMQQQAMLGYQQDFRQLRADSTISSLVEEPTMQFILQNSCPHLLVALGLLLLMMDQGLDPETRFPLND